MRQLTATCPHGTATATVTVLTLELQSALEAAGLRPKSAAHVVSLLPPAGQNEMFTGLRDNQGFLTEPAETFIGDVADRLRITHSSADIIRSYCRMVAA